MTPTVFTWPTTLYVSALVAPITRNVLSVTSSPSAAERRMTRAEMAVRRNSGAASSSAAAPAAARSACGSTRGSERASVAAARGAKRMQSWLESASGACVC